MKTDIFCNDIFEGTVRWHGGSLCHVAADGSGILEREFIHGEWIQGRFFDDQGREWVQQNTGGITTGNDGFGPVQFHREWKIKE